MTFRALEIFLAVADEKSFGKAAQKLFISQPSVTQQIKKLENEFGFTLFHRDKHIVELTEAGEIIHEAARSILSTYHQAIMNSMKCIAAEETLNIGYVGQMNEHLLPKIIRSFQDSYQQQNILTTRLLPYQVAAALEQRTLRMVMTPYDLVENDPQIHFCPLYYDRHYCVMHKESLLAARQSVSYQDLSGFTILTPSEKFCPDHMRRALDELKETNQNCRFVIGHESNNATLQVLSSKKKIAIMPGYTRPTHQDIVSVPLDNGIQIKVGVAYMEALSSLEKAFISTSLQVLNPQYVNNSEDKIL